MPYKELPYDEYQRKYEFYKKNYKIVRTYEKPSIMTLSGKKLWVLLKER